MRKNPYLIFMAVFVVLFVVPPRTCHGTQPVSTETPLEIEIYPLTQEPLALPTVYGTTSTPTPNKTPLALPTVYPAPLEKTELPPEYEGQPDPEKRYDPNSPEFQLPPEMNEEEIPAEVREIWLSYVFWPESSDIGEATACSSEETWEASGGDLEFANIAIRFVDDGDDLVIMIASVIDRGQTTVIQVDEYNVVTGDAVYLYGQLPQDPAILQLMNCAGTLKMNLFIDQPQPTAKPIG